MAADVDVSLEDVVEGRATEAEVEAFNEARREQFSERIERRQRERSEERQHALDALRDPAVHTATVQSGDVELTVKTTVSEPVRQEFADFADTEDEDAQIAFMAEMMEWFIESPEDYTDPGLWHDYADELGLRELEYVFEIVIGPMLERTGLDEAIEKFRSGADGAAVPSDE